MMLRGGLIAVLATLALGALVVSCGGSGGGSSSGSIGGSSNPAAAVAACEARLPQLNTTGLPSNTASVVIDQGPCAFNSASGTAYIVGSANIAFTSVTVCIPGTSTCQTIDHIMVDTGSSGLRIMSSVLNSNMALPAQLVAGAPIVECGQFADGYTWGSVRSADISVGGPPNASGFFTGETTISSVNVQVIGDSSAYVTPSSCTGTGPALNDVASFHANGILGVGLFVNDCSSTGACPSTGVSSPLYYQCPSASGCAPYSASIKQQVSNPVAVFATDKTGVVMDLPAVTNATGEQNVYGTLVFLDASAGTTAISTGSTQVYYADVNFGDFYSAITSSSQDFGSSAMCANSFIDSGSNGFFIPTSSLNIPADSGGWFIPSGTVSVTAGIVGVNIFSPTSIPTKFQSSPTFSIANADTVLFPANNGANTAYSNLGGPSGGPCDTTYSGNPSSASTSTTGIDWGLPFFYGRPIYTALETTQLTVAGTTYVGPFWAF